MKVHRFGLFLFHFSTPPHIPFSTTSLSLSLHRVFPFVAISFFTITYSIQLTGSTFILSVIYFLLPLLSPSLTSNSALERPINCTLTVEEYLGGRGCSSTNKEFARNIRNASYTHPTPNCHEFCVCLSHIPGISLLCSPSCLSITGTVHIPPARASHNVRKLSWTYSCHLTKGQARETTPNHTRRFCFRELACGLTDEPAPNGFLETG